MKLGVVGLPNVGKSTLFNAITQAGAESANYPFCTIEPNVGVVAVPDPRLEALARVRRRAKDLATSFCRILERSTQSCTWSDALTTPISRTLTVASIL